MLVVFGHDLSARAAARRAAGASHVHLLLRLARVRRRLRDRSCVAADRDGARSAALAELEQGLLLLFREARWPLVHAYSWPPSEKKAPGAHFLDLRKLREKKRAWPVGGSRWPQPWRDCGQGSQRHHAVCLPVPSPRPSAARAAASMALAARSQLLGARPSSGRSQRRRPWPKEQTCARALERLVTRTT